MRATVAIFLARDTIRAPDHTKRTCDDTIPAAVADIVLHVDIAELVVNDRAGWTRMFARRRLTVLADITQHQPARRTGCFIDLLVERDVPPGGA